MKNHPMERTVRTNAPEARGDRGVSEDTQRAQDDGLVSDEEFSRLLNEDFDDAALPKPPVMPGWHLCWVSTTSNYDTPARRQRLGYLPVRMAEYQEKFDPTNGRSLVGHEGFVTCNEMLLMKIREERYQQIMLHYHHKQPLREEAGIVEQTKEAAEQHAQRSGKPVQMGSGITDMEQSVRRGENATPTFDSA